MILMFPPQPQPVGAAYDAPNGYRYIFDGEKWLADGNVNVVNSFIPSISANIVTANSVVASQNIYAQNFYFGNGAPYLPQLPIASVLNLGGVRIGANINVNSNGVIDVPSPLNLGNLSVTDQTIMGSDINGDIVITPNGTGSVSVPSLKIPVGSFVQGNSPITVLVANLSLNQVLRYSTNSSDNLQSGDYGILNGISGSGTGWSVYQMTTNPSPILRVGDHITGINIPYLSNVLAIGTGVNANVIITDHTLNNLSMPDTNTVIYTSRDVVNSGLNISTTSNTDISLVAGIGGSIVSSTNILPLVDDLLDLGSPARRWRHLWLGAGTIYVLDETLGTDQSIGAKGGNLYVGGGTGFTVGKFTLYGNTIAISNPTEDFFIGTNIATGNLNINRPIQVLSSSEYPSFSVDRTGRTRIRAPIIPANDIGAFSIVGTANGDFQPVTSPGGMLHVTGNDGFATRLSLDNFNNGNATSSFNAIVARGGGGTAAAPTQSLANDILFRLTATGYRSDTGFSGVSAGGATTSLDVVALEPTTNATRGTAFQFFNANIGGNARVFGSKIDSTGLSFVQPVGSIIDANIGITFNDSTRQTTAYSNTAVSSYIKTDTSITSINANIAAANVAISTLTSNASSQATDITTLYSNAGTQATQINLINANITAANAAITTLTANAGSQATDIITLYSNTGSQATQINLINANVIAANTSIITANSAVTSYVNSLNSTMTANITAANAAIAGLSTVARTGSFGDLLNKPSFVNSLTIGAGFATSGTFTGNVSIDATGVQTLVSGSTSLTIADAGSKNLTISLPQNLAPTSNVTFANVTVTGNLSVQGITTTGGSTSLSGKVLYLANGAVTTNDIEAAGIILGPNLGVASRSFLYKYSAGDYWDTDGAGLKTLNLYAGNISITGNLTVASQNSHFGLASATIDYPNSTLQIDENVNSYSQIVSMNHSSGTNASTDIVAVNDTGTDGTNFIDMGINSSGYAGAGVGWTISGPNDAYLYNNGGNLTIGTSGAGNIIVFHTGGTLSANQRAKITDIGLTVVGNVVAANVNTSYGISFGDATIQTTAAQTLVNSAVSTLNANIGAIVNNVATLQSNASTQATQIDLLNANVSAANAAIISANNAVTSYVNSLNSTMTANITAANAAISTLTSNAASQASDLTTLYANAGTQATQINLLNANVTAANAAISSVTSTWLANAAYQEGEIASLNANVAAANVAISGVITAWNANAATQDTAISGLRANIIAANSAISTINANVAAANVAIANLVSTTQTFGPLVTSLNANAIAANSAISTLTANAATQENEISGLRANIIAANSAIATINYSNANVGAYLATYTANVANAVHAYNANVATLANSVVNGVYTTDAGTVTNFMLNGNISNDKILNAYVTVNTGAGLSGGQSVALGAAMTIQNTGVIKVFGGSGITANVNSGNIGLTNTGVIGLFTGAGITANASAGNISITNNDLGSSQYIFKNFAVAGQSTVTATTNNDTANLVAGTGIAITTSGKNITIASTANDGVVNLYSGNNIVLTTPNVGNVSISRVDGLQSIITTNLAATYVLSATDQYFGTARSLSGACTVTLPLGSTVTPGRQYTIKDEGGQAQNGGSHITINASGSDKIDGASSVVIKVGYGALTLLWTGVTWSRI